MAAADISADVARAVFLYDPDTGVIRWRSNPFGRKCGRPTTNGHIQISYIGRRYMAHRIAWVYHYGTPAPGFLDHINRAKDDNRIANLRVATTKQNGENVWIHSHNTSGRRGVRFREKTQRWEAEIKHYKRTIHLGSFPTIIDAVAARIRAERKFFTHAPGLVPELQPIAARPTRRTSEHAAQDGDRPLRQAARIPGPSRREEVGVAGKRSAEILASQKRTKSEQLTQVLDAAQFSFWPPAHS